MLIHVHTGKDVLTEEQDEAEEWLDAAGGEGVERIRVHLNSTTEMVAIELGWSQLKDMGVVFAGMVAEYMAGAGCGLIRDPHGVWWAVDDQIPVQLAAPA